MKIVEIIEHVELYWSNDRWNLSLSGSAEGFARIARGLIYDRTGSFYIAQNEGLINFCSAGSDGACGGSFTMRDGSIENVVGAWSSNSDSVFKATGIDSVSASFNNQVIALSIPALKAIGVRFGFVINEVTDAYRHHITPIPPATRMTLVDRS
ncbi:hypothetical protein [Pseudomonas umsongensis]|uniref:Uncharacterized protein n=1 Tax=Pseudomonas umsongensis TaxID=198618 RepID=A0AAE6ZU59_9PSED|nr:hypothetical protein [Pseudomonas umsongensis]QJC78933.1 hypothetical protein HGP31_11630 [Pseudomonas umsongensis]